MTWLGTGCAVVLPRSGTGSCLGRRGAILPIPTDAPGHAVALGPGPGEETEGIYTPRNVTPRRIGDPWTMDRGCDPEPVPPRPPAAQGEARAPPPTATEIRTTEAGGRASGRALVPRTPARQTDAKAPGDGGSRFALLDRALASPPASRRPQLKNSMVLALIQGVSMADRTLTFNPVNPR